MYRTLQAVLVGVLAVVFGLSAFRAGSRMRDD
jgi:hypothetical protein